MIAAGCLDGRVRLLDASNGEELLILPGERVGFSPDGKYLWTMTEDELTHVYYLDAKDLIALAHRRLFRTWTTDECQKYLHTQTCPPTP